MQLFIELMGAAKPKGHNVPQFINKQTMSLIVATNDDPTPAILGWSLDTSGNGELPGRLEFSLTSSPAWCLGSTTTRGRIPEPYLRVIMPQ